MSARGVAEARVRAVRRTLATIVIARAVAWGAAIGAVVHGVGIVVSVRPVADVLAVLAAIAVVARAVWRDRAVWSLAGVALWVEEQVPALGAALITVLDRAYASDAAAAALHPSVRDVASRIDATPHLRRAAWTNLAPALGAVALTSVLASRATPVFGVNAARRDPVASSGTRLIPLTAVVTPPAYTGQRNVTVHEPVTIRGIVGSRIVLTGHGSATGVSITGDSGTIDVVGRDGTWSAEMRIGVRPGILRLADRQYHRLVIVDPIPDAPPVVRLTSPKEDTTARQIAPSATLRLEADVRDDIGIADAHFEYIVSSGSEETFTFRQGTLGEAAFDGARDARLRAAVPYGRFQLKPGDQLSVRAVARDGNVVSGPGIGASETRTIRIAPLATSDSVAVAAAPPATDTTMVSLRMLIVMTEQLDRERSTIPRSQVVRRSEGLGDQASQVRNTVIAVRDDQTGHGEAAANPLLSTAIDALWDAAASLQIADPHGALPRLLAAYRAIRAFSAVRHYYMRGLQHAPPVDIARERLAGHDSASAGPLVPRVAGDSTHRAWAAAYADGARLIATAPERAADVFTVLRATVRDQPALAATLDTAIAALRARADAGPVLSRVRRTIDGAPAVADSIPVWGRVW